MIWPFLLGCGAPPPAAFGDCDGACLVVDFDSGVAEWRFEGEVRTRLHASGFQVGTGAPQEASFDTWWTQPFWREGRGPFVPEDGGFRVAAGDGWIHVAPLASAGDGQGLRLTATGIPDAGFWRVEAEAGEGEAFYGLGETFDRVEQRGVRRALQLEIDATLESFTNEAHVPVPLLIGTEGWGLFAASRHPIVADVAASEDDRVAFEVGTGRAFDEGLDIHLFASAHPADVTSVYWELTGLPGLPPEFAHGPLIWRDENVDQDQFEADLQTIRDLDLATSGVWIDRPYASGVNTFDFDPVAFPDPTGMMAHASNLGFPVALWHTPYVDPQDAGERHAEAEAAGWFPPVVPPFVLNDWSHPIDFTNPAAQDGWRAWLAETYGALGIAGYKLDYGEDIALGINGLRVPWAFSDGSDESTMHKLYPLLYHAPYADSVPGGAFLLCRASTWGGQTLAPVIWPGDLDADMSRMGDPKGDTGAVGGLPAAVAGGLSLAASGFPYYASDTGGYRDAPANDEAFVRWFGASTWMPFMQVGNGASTLPWEGSADVLDLYRDAARTHLRLFPYFRALTVQAAAGGRPPMVALGLAHPELGVHPSDVWLLGPAVLVAPVVDAGLTTRAIDLPDGEWWPWAGGPSVRGSVVVDAPLGAVPVFVGPGAIVPMLRDTIDGIVATSDLSIDTLASDPGPLTVRIVPKDGASFTAADGTAWSVEDDGVDVRIALTPGTTWQGDGVIELVGVSASVVAIDGVGLVAGDGGAEGFRADPWLTAIAVPPGAASVVVTR